MRALNICGKPKANIEEPQVLLKAYAANTMFKTRNFNEFQWSPSICSRLSPTPHLKIRFLPYSQARHPAKDFDLYLMRVSKAESAKQVVAGKNML